MQFINDSSKSNQNVKDLITEVALTTSYDNVGLRLQPWFTETAVHQFINGSQRVQFHRFHMHVSYVQ